MSVPQSTMSGCARTSLLLLIVLQLVASTTPVSEPRGWSMNMPDVQRKRDVENDIAQKEAMKSMRDCLAKVFYGGGTGATGETCRDVESHHPNQMVRQVNLDKGTELNTKSPGSAVHHDSFAKSSAFVASVPAQKGGSAFWIPQQDSQKSKATLPRHVQEDAHLPVSRSPVLKEDKRPVKVEEPHRTDAIKAIPAVGDKAPRRKPSALKRAISYEALGENGSLEGKTYRLPHTEKRSEGVEAQAASQTAPADRTAASPQVASPAVPEAASKSAAAVEAVSSASDEEDTKAVRRSRTPWLPFLDRQSEVRPNEPEQKVATSSAVKSREGKQEDDEREQQQRDREGARSEGGGGKARPAMWLPPRPAGAAEAGEEEEAEEEAEEVAAPKPRVAPWVPATPPTGAAGGSSGGGKQRPALWLPGQAGGAAGAGGEAAAEKERKRRPMWLPQSGGGAGAKAAGAGAGKAARGKPWVPGAGGAGPKADGWPAEDAGGWKPKYDMAKGMESEEEVGKEGRGPSWKPKYDMAKALEMAEAAPPVGRPKGKAGEGGGGGEGAAGGKVSRSSSPGTLKLQERRREMAEREREGRQWERRRNCDRCAQLCRGAWLMGYDRVHCSDACLRATEQEVCGAWEEGWDSVEAFLRPRGGPRLYPNAVVPGLGLQPGA